MLVYPGAWLDVGAGVDNVVLVYPGAFGVGVELRNLNPFIRSCFAGHYNCVCLDTIKRLQNENE